MTARCSCGAALSGGRVFCWIDAKLAQLRRAHTSFRLRNSSIVHWSSWCLWLHAGRGNTSSRIPARIRFFLVAHVITEPGSFSSMRAIRS
jgi:hypothetical protein